MMELLNTLNQGNSFFVCLFFGRTEVLNSGFELKTYHLSHTSSPFCSGNFGDGRGGGGSHELFAQTGLEPRSS
jgi:hypothetical protein